MKATISFLNSIALLPILFYPMVWAMSTMVFSNPAVERKLFAHLIYWCLVGYPIPIIAAVFFSFRHNSFWLSLVALIPALAICFALLLAQPNKGKKEDFETKPRDFVCNSRKFIYLEEFGKWKHPWLYEKKMFSYKATRLGKIDGNTFNISRSKSSILSELNECKNSEGKSLIELYTVVKMRSRSKP